MGTYRLPQAEPAIEPGHGRRGGKVHEVDAVPEPVHLVEGEVELVHRWRTPSASRQ